MINYCSFKGAADVHKELKRIHAMDQRKDLFVFRNLSKRENRLIKMFYAYKRAGKW